jgi:hypothetical protein
LKVLIASFDPPAFPCARLRLLDPLELAPGVEVRHALETRNGAPAFRMDLLAWADVVVTQRGFPQPATRALLEPLLAAGKPVVYETDDCLPEVPDFLGKPHYREWGPDLIAWVKRVAAVTVPTAALAEYFAPHARHVHVLPNYLLSRTRPPGLAAPRVPDPTRIEIGYAGNPGHRTDCRQHRQRYRQRSRFIGRSRGGCERHPDQRCNQRSSQNYGQCHRNVQLRRRTGRRLLAESRTGRIQVRRTEGY